MTKTYFAEEPGEEFKVPTEGEKEAQKKREDGALGSNCLQHFEPQKRGYEYAGSLGLYCDTDNLHSQQKTVHVEEMAC